MVHTLLLDAVVSRTHRPHRVRPSGCGYPLGASITVGPTPLPHDIAWPRPRAAHFGLSESTPIGDEVYRTVRPYVRGDSRRRVHWKASAHHGSLMVKESDGTGIVSLRIVLQLDAPASRRGGRPGPGGVRRPRGVGSWLVDRARHDATGCDARRAGGRARVAVPFTTGRDGIGDRTDTGGRSDGHIRACRSHHAGHRLLWRRSHRVGRPASPCRHTRRATDGTERSTGATLVSCRPRLSGRSRRPCEGCAGPRVACGPDATVSYRSCWPRVSPARGSTTQ